MCVRVPVCVCDLAWGATSILSLWLQPPSLEPVSWLLANPPYPQLPIICLGATSLCLSSSWVLLRPAQGHSPFPVHLALVHSCPVNIWKFRPHQSRPVSCLCPATTDHSRLSGPESGDFNLPNSRGHMPICASGFLEAPPRIAGSESGIHRTSAVSAKYRHPHFSKVCFMLHRLYKRPILILVFTNWKKCQRFFASMEKGENWK